MILKCCVESEVDSFSAGLTLPIHTRRLAFSLANQTFIEKDVLFRPVTNLGQGKNSHCLRKIRPSVPQLPRPHALPLNRRDYMARCAAIKFMFN